MDLAEKQAGVYQLFDRILANHALKHAYLFEGLAGVGKLEMSRYIAKRRFCPNQDQGQPCQVCPTCLRIDQGQHPDVVEIAPEGKGRSIRVDRVRQVKDALSKSGVESQKKMIILNQADKMTHSAANSLLKFLEDPAGDVTIFLLVASRQNLLPTIVSRCQVIQFAKQDLKTRIMDLVEAGLSQEEAHLASHLTQDLDLAKSLIEEDDLLSVSQKIWQWFSYLMNQDDLAFILVQRDLMAFIQDRDDCQMVCDLILYLFQDLLHLHYHLDSPACYVGHESDLRYFMDRLSIKQVSYAMQATLQAKREVDHNVASQAVLEGLTLDLQESIG